MMKKKRDRAFAFEYAWAVAFWLFQERQKPDHALDSVSLPGTSKDIQRIRCPLCGWKPNSSSRWFCGDCDYPEYFYDGCGTAWNTFTTRGLCPGCAHQWRWTICLRCAGWSRHEEWYRKKKN
jgi:hypothetical protein